jgi:type IV secretory pathway TraG/TraD family ATPase VirD4
LRPLHSLWIDLLVLRLLNEPKESQHPVWFVLDELASLQRLPQLHTAITENRKSKNPLVLGFQGKAQLEVIYGHMAEVMLSQPATKIFLKTTEPKAAEWVSNAIGKVEIERLRETHSTGLPGRQQFQLERQVEPLVLDSEISGLPDRHAFLKLATTLPGSRSRTRHSCNTTCVSCRARWKTTTLLRSEDAGEEAATVGRSARSQRQRGRVDAGGFSLGD